MPHSLFRFRCKRRVLRLGKLVRRLRCLLEASTTFNRSIIQQMNAASADFVLLHRQQAQCLREQKQGLSAESEAKCRRLEDHYQEQLHQHKQQEQRLQDQLVAMKKQLDWAYDEIHRSNARRFEAERRLSSANLPMIPANFGR